MLTFASVMNRNIFLLIGFAYFFMSCGNKTKQKEATMDDIVDTVELAADTAYIFEPEVKPLSPAGQNESFEDFIYAFSSDTAFQLGRIVFPLTYYKENNALKIEKKYWAHDPLFIRQNYYTLLLDHEDELDSSFDNGQTSVQVEWIYMKNHTEKRYYFERTDGRWKLEAINLRPIQTEKRADFVDFFLRFAADSLYQAQHIREPLIFVTTDPDDDFSIIETTLDVEQWFAFKPLLPEAVLSNIIYGKEQPERNTPVKILQLKGIGNGFMNTLYFRRKSNGQWELYKYEDTSN